MHITHAKTETEQKSKALPNLIYNVNNDKIKTVTAEALKVYPFDYREGYLTHGTGGHP